MCAAKAVASRARALRAFSVYWRVAGATYRRYSTYRMATLAAVLEISVQSMIRAFVLIAVVRTIGGNASELTPREAATFAFLAGSIELAMWVTIPLDIDQRIRTGDVVVDLQRPVDFQLWWFAHDAGRAAYMVLTRGLPPYLFGVLVLDIVPPASVASALLFAVSVVLGFTVAFAWRFLVGLSGFWLLDTRGTQSLAALVFTVGSGALLPLSLFPDPFGDVLRVLPLAAIVQTPFEVFVGERAALPALGSQLVWSIALLLLGRLVLRRAVAKVVVQGG